MFAQGLNDGPQRYNYYKRQRLEQSTGNEWSSENVNESIDWNFFVTPPQYNPRWIFDYPLGAFMFGRSNLSRKTKYIIKPIQTIEIYTPEQLNYHLHFEALKRGTKGPRESLFQIFNEYSPVGKNTTPPCIPENSDRQYVGEERKMNFNPRVDTKMVNYWGHCISGRINATIGFVLKEIPLTEEGITYSLSSSDNDIRPLGNVCADGTILDRVPQWVAFASEMRTRPNHEQIKYEIIDGIKRPKLGYFIYVGKCILNHEYSAAATKLSCMASGAPIVDMKTSSAMRRIDVAVQISTNGN